MRVYTVLTALGMWFCMPGLTCLAQQPPDRPPGPGRQARSVAVTADGIVERMMLFDKNSDGKLTRDEITDSRLLRVFDRADTNKDGVVTKDELTALAAKMVEEQPDDRDQRRGPPDGQEGGGQGRFGPPGGPPQPGQVLPPFLQQRLNLSSDQKKQLRRLQKEVDAKLAKILTPEQMKQMKEMRPPGFGRGGPGGGQDDQGGPGGGPGRRGGQGQGGPGQGGPGQGGPGQGGQGRPGGPPGGPPPDRDQR